MHQFHSVELQVDSPNARRVLFRAQIPGTQPTFIFKVEKETNPTAGYRLKNVTEDSGQRMDADTIVRCEFVYQ